jgi:hypothetical protein
VCYAKPVFDDEVGVVVDVDPVFKHTAFELVVVHFFVERFPIARTLAFEDCLIRLRTWL